MKKLADNLIKWWWVDFEHKKCALARKFSYQFYQIIKHTCIHNFFIAWSQRHKNLHTFSVFYGTALLQRSSATTAWEAQFLAKLKNCFYPYSVCLVVQSFILFKPCLNFGIGIGNAILLQQRNYSKSSKRGKTILQTCHPQWMALISKALSHSFRSQ